MLSLRERHARHYTQSDGCWPWHGSLSEGYGRIKEVGSDRNSRSLYAHRVAYELHVGPIPPGMVVDLVCLTRNCVNPAHMEVVTRAENTRRENARRTHCIHGHEFTPQNTYVRKDGQGRVCRTCQRSRVAAYSQRRRTAFPNRRRNQP